MFSSCIRHFANQSSKMVGKFEHLVFVYGTLKQNQPNNKVMKDTANGMAEFVCSATTVNKYPLVIASQFNIPFLLAKPGTGNQISGEVYSLDSRMLAFLDEFEGHPGYYTRLETPVQATDGTVLELKPWLYILEKYKPEMLHMPMYSNYDSYGDHGLPYVERYLRQAECEPSGHLEQSQVQL